MINNELQESINSIMIFYRLYKTIEAGELVKICQEIDEHPSVLEDGSLAKLVAEFISQLYE